MAKGHERQRLSCILYLAEQSKYLKYMFFFKKVHIIIGES